MWTLRFYLDTSYPGAESYIFADMSVNGLRHRKSTNIKIPPSQWSLRNYRVKEKYEFATFINKYLDTITNKFREANIFFTSERIRPTKTQLYDYVFKPISSPTEDLFERYEEYFNSKKKTITPNSIKIYRSAITYFKKFRPNADGLTEKTIEQFSQWLLNKKLSPNTIVKMVGSMVSFSSYIGKPVILKDRVKAKKTDSIALSLEEISQLINVKLDDRLSPIRDTFVFGCFTGLRYSDLVLFNPDNIQVIDNVKCLVFYSKKTGAKSVIPLFKEAAEVLKKNKGDLPKRISDQKFNEYLKEVCEQAGLTQIISIAKLKGNSKVVIQLPKYQAASSHLMRRSFITNMSILGLTPKEISLMTGHTQMSIVDIYDKSNPERNAVKVFENLKGRV